MEANMAPPKGKDTSLKKDSYQLLPFPSLHLIATQTAHRPQHQNNKQWETYGKEGRNRSH